MAARDGLLPTVGQADLAQAAVILLSTTFKIGSGALRARIASEVVGNGRELGRGNMDLRPMRGRAVLHPGRVSTRGLPPLSSRLELEMDQHRHMIGSQLPATALA
jgi:hypothetical protein